MLTDPVGRGWKRKARCRSQGKKWNVLSEESNTRSSLIFEVIDMIKVPTPASIKPKFVFAHLKVAEVYAELSSAKKLKVGAVLVKGGTPIAIGYNGTKAGACNCCEDENGKTLPGVRHAEINALNKLWTSKESAEGAISFQTHSPCIECVQDLHAAGIRDIYFSERYRSDEGIKWAIEHDMCVFWVTADDIFRAGVDTWGNEDSSIDLIFYSITKNFSRL